MHCTTPRPRTAVAYVDTVAFLMNQQPPNEFWQSIRPHCGSATMRRSRVGHGTVRVLVNQPQPQAIKAVADLEEKRYVTVQALHVALDFMADTPEEAANLTTWLRARFVKRWRGKHRRRDFRRTAYWSAQRWGSNNLAMYGDRPSKLTGRPCAHLEWRVSGTSQVKALGIRYPRHLGTFDPAEFWQKRLVLREVDMIALGKQARGRGRAKDVEPLDRRCGHLICRACAGVDKDGGLLFEAQRVADVCQAFDWFDKRTALRSVPGPMVMSEDAQFLTTPPPSTPTSTSPAPESVIPRARAPT